MLLLIVQLRISNGFRLFAIIHQCRVHFYCILIIYWCDNGQCFRGLVGGLGAAMKVTNLGRSQDMYSFVFDLQDARGCINEDTVMVIFSLPE